MSKAHILKPRRSFSSTTIKYLSPSFKDTHTGTLHLPSARSCLLVPFSLIIFLNLLLLLLVYPSSPAHAEAFDEALDHPITLSEIIQRALQHNKTLQGAEYSVTGQQVSLDTAQSEFDIKLHPQALAGTDQDGEQLGAGVHIEKKFTAGPIASLAPRYGKLQDEYTGSIALALSIPLLRGRGDEYVLDNFFSNRYQLDLFKLQKKGLEEDVVFQAIALVYDIINAQEQVKIYKNTINRHKNSLIFAKAKEQIGVASPMDVYRIAIAIKESEDNLIQSKNILAQNKDRLKVLISYPLANSINVTAPLIHEEMNIDTEQAYSIAMDKRIDIQMLKLELEETRRTIKISEHNLLPQLRLNIDYDNTAVDFFGNSILEGEERWGVRLEGDTDLSRDNEKADLIRNTLDLRRKNLVLQDRIENIKESIKSEIVSLEKSKLRYSIRQQQKVQAEGKLALANLKFRFGMSDNFEVIQSENELQNALLSLTSVRSEYIIGTYRLRQQLGTLLE